MAEGALGVSLLDSSCCLKAGVGAVTDVGRDTVENGFGPEDVCSDGGNLPPWEQSVKEMDSN